MSLTFPEPHWLAELPPEDREAACLRFQINMAILYASPDMTNTAFADAIGISESAISQVKRRGRITADLAVRIEAVCGRDAFPREWFRPDLFTLPTE